MILEEEKEEEEEEEEEEQKPTFAKYAKVLISDTKGKGLFFCFCGLVFW